MEGSGQTVVVMAGALHAPGSLGFQLALLKESGHISGGGHHVGPDLAAPLGVLLLHDLRVIAVQHHHRQSDSVDGLRTGHGLLADLLGITHQVAQHDTGGRLLVQDLGGNTGFFQDGEQVLRHLGCLNGGHFADVHQHVGSVLAEGGLLHTVKIAGGQHIVDQGHDGLRSQLVNHGLRPGLPDKQRGLITCGAVIGAGVTQQALIHRLGHILVKGLLPLVDHAQQQALGPGGIDLFSGLMLDRAQMTAHPAEAALLSVMQCVLTNHILLPPVLSHRPIL